MHGVKAAGYRQSKSDATPEHAFDLPPLVVRQYRHTTAVLKQARDVMHHPFVTVPMTTTTTMLMDVFD